MDKKTAASEKELTLDEIRKVSSSLGRLKMLLLSGGEPFLRDDLAGICEIFCKQNKILNVYLPTNGFYTEKIFDMTYEILDKCADIALNINLSLDGLEKTHDRIKDVEGSFKKVVETTKRLSQLKEEFDNLYLYIITVVNNVNINEVIQLCEFVKNNLPVDGHGPSPLRGTPYDTTLDPPSFKEWEDLSKRLIEYHKFWNRKSMDNRIKAFLATNRVRYLYDLYTYVLKNKKLPFICRAGEKICVLEPNGDVKLCELTEAVGNVKSTSYDIKKVISSSKANEVKNRLKDCACTHACFLNPSIEMNIPELFKSYFCGGL